jgi:protein TonB
MTAKDMNQMTLIRSMILLSILVHVLLILTVKWRPKPGARPTADRFTVELLYKTGVSEKAVESQEPHSTLTQQNRSETILEDDKEEDRQEAKPLAEPVHVEEEPPRPTVGETALETAESLKSTELLKTDSTSLRRSPTETLSTVSAYIEQSKTVDYASIVDRLRERLASSLVYPRSARKRGIEGTVVVRLELDRTGDSLELQVLRSSGSEILDRAALNLIGRILPFDHGLDHPLSVEVPIAYRLVNR